MTRWEYHVEVTRPPLGKGVLNELGEAGWELAAVAIRGEHGSFIYTFKRELA
jgi:hypothetical protein